MLSTATPARRPGFGEKAGFAASIAAIALTGLVLYLIFKRRDWLEGPGLWRYRRQVLASPAWPGMH
jgi:hypothetical protein